MLLYLLSKLVAALRSREQIYKKKFVMAHKKSIRFFNDRQVRAVWDEKQAGKDKPKDKWKPENIHYDKW